MIRKFAELGRGFRLDTPLSGGRMVAFLNHLDYTQLRQQQASYAKVARLLRPSLADPAGQKQEGRAGRPRIGP